MSGTADLHKAIVALWNSENLDAEFTSRGGSLPALHDMEATPAQPFPYCVFEQSPGIVVTRMAGDYGTHKYHTRDVPWQFRIHAGPQGGQSAKQTAAALADRVMRVYGGHPTADLPAFPAMDNGENLVTQYITDYGMRTGDEEYEWIVSYNCRLDVPVRV